MFALVRIVFNIYEACGAKRHTQTLTFFDFCVIQNAAIIAENSEKCIDIY